MNLEWMLGIENLPWALLAVVIWLSTFGDLAARAGSAFLKADEEKPYRSNFPFALVLAAFIGASLYFVGLWNASAERDARHEEHAMLIGQLSPDHEWAIQTFRSCSGGSVNCAASTLTLARENHRDVDQVKDAMLRWSKFTGMHVGIDAPEGSTEVQ